MYARLVSIALLVPQSRLCALTAPCVLRPVVALQATARSALLDISVSMVHDLGTREERRLIV
jgi:hypothetical protein